MEPSSNIESKILEAVVGFNWLAFVGVGGLESRNDVLAPTPWKQKHSTQLQVRTVSIPESHLVTGYDEFAPIKTKKYAKLFHKQAIKN